MLLAKCGCRSLYSIVLLSCIIIFIISFNNEKPSSNECGLNSHYVISILSLHRLAFHDLTWGCTGFLHLPCLAKGVGSSENYVKETITKLSKDLNLYLQFCEVLNL